MSTSLSLRRLRLPLHHRLLSTSAHRLAAPFGAGPAPPRLPEAEQKRFEELQRASTGAFSTPRQLPEQPSATESTSSTETASPESSTSADYDSAPAVNARVEADGKGKELHPNIRRGAPPEFEGEVNPKTGEVGGPKNDPLRWQGDWAYNGRVTDF